MFAFVVVVFCPDVNEMNSYVIRCYELCALARVIFVCMTCKPQTLIIIFPSLKVGLSSRPKSCIFLNLDYLPVLNLVYLPIINLDYLPVPNLDYQG